MDKKYHAEEILLVDIFLDRETQVRVTVSEETVQRYFDAMVDEAARDAFPPVTLFRDPKNRLWLADGHHRVMAAKRRKFTSILAVVRSGTQTDAIWEAAKANGRNGLQLSNVDIRRAIGMIVSVPPERSNRAIAEAIGCSYKTVERYRHEFSTGTAVPVERRVGRDGKSRPATRKTEPTTDKNVPNTALESPPAAKKADQSPNTPSPTNDTTVAKTGRVAEPSNEPNFVETSDDRRRIEANAKEAEIEVTISLLRRQIDEWFEIALDDMHEEFDQRVRKQLLAIVD